MQDGLYILRVTFYQNLQIKLVKSSHITNTVNFTASDLGTCWHFQLGHVSNKSISKINFLLSNITNLLFVMFVILQSKKDFPFHLSSSKSKKCFDLIYVDVWGPYSLSSSHGHKYFLTIVDDYSR